ncbi:HNH endonuclease signature motif containing protein [Luteolibacter rhizosphaerae]|uniref:HNH endonuclease signature motif containing protein n=1 Tax=Luteolibacter rhizosphaerae TaxID=2989719 RepID=UPI0031F336CA
MRNARFTRKISKAKTFRSLRDTRTYDRSWHAYSRRYLVAHPICYCDHVRTWQGGTEVVVSFGPAGTVAPAGHTDHIRPVRMGGAMYDPTNHQPLCHSCHSKKTARWG